MDGVYVNTNLTNVGNRVLRMIQKGETNVRLYKIGHISENMFGEDSKTYTNDRYGPSAVLRKKKRKWGDDKFLRSI